MPLQAQTDFNTVVTKFYPYSPYINMAPMKVMKQALKKNPLIKSLKRSAAAKSLNEQVVSWKDSVAQGEDEEDDIKRDKGEISKPMIDAQQNKICSHSFVTTQIHYTAL